MQVSVVQDNFGVFDEPNGNSTPIKRFTLTHNKTGISAQVITYGATLTSLRVPDKNGQLDDIILGFDDMEGYLGKRIDNPYFGASIGRVVNRIANATFTLDGQEVKLNVNAAHTHPTVSGQHNLHGGFRGFDKRVWEAHVVQGKGVTLSYVSADGEEGFPGIVLVNVTFELRSDELFIKFQATSNKPTPVALTNHPYFNLAGHKNAHSKGLENHWLHINADHYLPVDETFIPTGELASVVGTEFDFLTKKNLFQLLQKYPHHYNHNFCINGEYGQAPRLAGRIEEETSGRILEILTDQPGAQFYTSTFMPGPNDEPIPGKEGARYFKDGSLCLETQNYPNAVNQKNFPNPTLYPGSLYIHQIVLRFSVTK